MNRRCLELRAADTGCNFYLGAAIAISAGLDGVRRKVDPGEPAEFNTYDPEQQGEELPRRDVQRLPRTLEDAIEAFARDERAKEMLAKAFHATFADYKWRESNDYSPTVTDWEHRRYLHQW